jgi:hypothetical protein
LLKPSLRAKQRVATQLTTQNSQFGQFRVERSEGLFQHLAVGRDRGTFEIRGSAGARELQRLSTVGGDSLLGCQTGTDSLRPCRFFLLSFHELGVESTRHT